MRVKQLLDCHAGVDAELLRDQYLACRKPRLHHQQHGRRLVDVVFQRAADPDSQGLRRPVWQQWQIHVG
jgi:hypothetical protein